MYLCERLQTSIVSTDFRNRLTVCRKICFKARITIKVPVFELNIKGFLKQNALRRLTDSKTSMFRVQKSLKPI